MAIEIYYAPGDIFDLNYVLFLLRHYGELEHYRYPPEPSGYVAAGRCSTFSGKSPHETCILIKSELDWRLGICSPEAYPDDRGHLARLLGELIVDEVGRLGKPYRELSGECKEGLIFVSSGQRRRRYTPAQFRADRKRKIKKIMAAGRGNSPAATGTAG